jgi:hypothetical protein
MMLRHKVDVESAAFAFAFDAARAQRPRALDEWSDVSVRSENRIREAVYEVVRGSLGMFSHSNTVCVEFSAIF